MPRKTVAKFQTDYIQIMDENGKVDSALMPKLSKDQIINMYKIMVFARKFDDKMLALQRQGRIGTFGQVKGQEAQIGAVAPLQKDDWMIPAFRETAAYAYLGMPLRNLTMYYGGDERGSIVNTDVKITPVSIPVGSQIPHGVGIAWGMKLKKKKSVAVCFFGDGATSEGDFNEGMNFAGVFKVPCVFICQNNQYAISYPVTKQTAAQTLAQKAISFGIEGIKVDGNDVFAMYAAAEYAIKKAREGKGPTLIEMFTYRIASHTTADDATKYRTEKEVKEWVKKDPISRLKKYMESHKMWTSKQEDALLKEIETKVNKEVEEFEKIGKPPLDDMFKYMYKEMTPQLKEQLEYIKQFPQK